MPMPEWGYSRIRDRSATRFTCKKFFRLQASAFIEPGPKPPGRDEIPSKSDPISIPDVDQFR